MMGAFLASLDKTIRRKVWEHEELPEIMMELLDTVIRLGDARELGRQSQQAGNKTSEKMFVGSSSGPSNGEHKKRKHQQK